LSGFYKQRRYMGSKDRGFVSQLVYYCLRQGGALQYWAERSALHEVKPRHIVLLGMVMGLDYSARRVIDACDGKQYAPKPLLAEERAMLEQYENAPISKPDMPEWARFNMQDWLIPLLHSEFQEHFVEEVEALNEEAPVDIRVNTLKCDERADLMLALDRDGFYGNPTPHSPLGIRLKKRLPIFTNQAFKDGWFEMQDEGSQLVAAIVDAKPGEKVIDFCAGAGGKTLALAAQMQNKGRLLAWDVNERRLSQIKKRLARAGVDNVLLHVLTSENDAFLKRHIGTADHVLVDAPCSGTGTWRRNPDLKWRFSRKDLEEIKAIQTPILHNAARLVAPNGRLIYATCSLLREENQDQIAAFLVEHPDFEVERLSDMWNKVATWEEGVGSFLRLSPARHQTDGFFAAVLKKK
jgi:16S rRNA (cytosine967-C5)-methyltransferase